MGRSVAAWGERAGGQRMRGGRRRRAAQGGRPMHSDEPFAVAPERGPKLGPRHERVMVAMGRPHIGGVGAPLVARQWEGML